MPCATKGDHVRTSLQTEPILPGGYGFLKAIHFAADILKHAFELSRACDRMLRRQRGRRQLRELDDWLLKDIGLTRAEAKRAGRKWFWQ